jgi:hypothetical protein
MCGCLIAERQRNIKSKDVVLRWEKLKKYLSHTRMVYDSLLPSYTFHTYR